MLFRSLATKRVCQCASVRALGTCATLGEGWVELTFFWSVRSFVAHCHDFACFQASNPSALSCEREQLAPRLHLAMWCQQHESAHLAWKACWHFSHSGVSIFGLSGHRPCAGALATSSSSVDSSLTAGLRAFFFSASFSLRFLPLLTFSAASLSAAAPFFGALSAAPPRRHLSTGLGVAAASAA